MNFNKTIDLNRFPNFLIVGANKGGTTSLYHYCQQHPEVVMSKIKEPMFFSAKVSESSNNQDIQNNNCARKTLDQILKSPTVVTSLDDYQNLFFVQPNTKSIGEASTSYLATYETVIPRVKFMYPDMKIIASLRHPIDRALSAYSMYHDAGLEKRSFEQCIWSEIKDINSRDFQGKKYLRHSIYYEPILNYRQAFGDEKVLVVLFDELKKDTPKVVKKIFNFLEVDDKALVDTEKKFNTAKQRQKHNKTIFDIEKSALNACIDFFYEDVKKLQELIDFEDVCWDLLM